MLAAADAALAQIDAVQLAAHFGRVLDKDDPDAVEARKEHDDAKATLLKALEAKCNAYASMMDVPEVVEGAAASFRETWTELKTWVDMSKDDNKTKYAALVVKRERLDGNLGLALAAAARMKDAKAAGALRAELLGELGWSALASAAKLDDVVSHPNSYALF